MSKPLCRMHSLGEQTYVFMSRALAAVCEVPVPYAKRKCSIACGPKWFTSCPTSDVAAVAFTKKPRLDHKFRAQTGLNI